MTLKGRFCLTVYVGNSTQAAVVHKSDLENWAQYEVLQMPGFDGSYSLSLSSLWAEFLAGDGKTAVEQNLTGYETIIKFGDTMQLTQVFRVRIEALMTEN